MIKTHHQYILLTTDLLQLAETYKGKGTQEVLDDLKAKLSVVKGIKVNAGTFSITIEYHPFYDDTVEQILEDFKKEYQYTK